MCSLHILNLSPEINQNQFVSFENSLWSMSHDLVIAGCVLVTFKSRLSVPPYRIENKTSDVVVYFAQSALKGTREKWNWLAPRPGGSAMAYAWDAPTAEHRLQVQVCLFLLAPSKQRPSRYSRFALWARSIYAHSRCENQVVGSIVVFSVQVSLCISTLIRYSRLAY